MRHRSPFRSPRLAARAGTATAVAAAVLVGAPGPIGPSGPVPEAAAVAIERAVADAPAPGDIRVAAVERRSDLLRILGDRADATDADALVALAGDVAPAPIGEGIFPVGDSTFVALATHLGHGSAYPGAGFALAPLIDDRVNPLDLPPAGFDGVVVIGVSIWDAPATDLVAYRAAVDRYRSAGHPVVVVGVPERFGPGDVVVTTPIEEAELAALNEGVARAVGCPLLPWTVRDVETAGDVGPSDDHVHPTGAGVDQLVTGLTEAAATPCVS